MSFDESKWPVVVLTALGKTTIEDAQLYTDTLGRILARQEPFALISIPQKTEIEADPEAANHSMKWLKTNKPLFGQYCVGMAVMAASEEYQARYGQMLNEQGPQIYGCPVTVVKTQAEADRWVRERLTA